MRQREGLRWGFWALLSLGLIPLIAGPAMAKDQAPRTTSVRAVLNREYLPEVLGMIRTAKESVQVIQFEWIAYGPVVEIEEALEAAARRGVKVRMLLDDSVKTTRQAVGRLAARGFEVKLDETKKYGESGDKTTHAKVFLVDKKKLILGSTNCSSHAIDKNNEANIYLESAEAGAAVAAYFDQLWSNAALEPDVQPCRLGDFDLIFNRQYVPTVTELFRKARKRIHVVLYGMNLGRENSTVRELIGELSKAKKRGVDVRFMLDQSTGEFFKKGKELNDEARDYFDEMGIPMKYDSLDVITHAKVVLVDNLAVVGGTNWGHGPLHQYNDCNAVVRRADAVKKLSDAFLKLWSGASRFD